MYSRTLLYTKHMCQDQAQSSLLSIAQMQLMHWKSEIGYKLPLLHQDSNHTACNANGNR